MKIFLPVIGTDRRYRVMDVPNTPVVTSSSHQDNQMARAVQITARKVEKKPKEETDDERKIRVREEMDKKRNKSTKAAARKAVKGKIVKKINTYFK
jgi:hypothetical protein